MILHEDFILKTRFVRDGDWYVGSWWSFLKQKAIEPILAQYSISIPSENVRKPGFLTFSEGIEMEHCSKIWLKGVMISHEYFILKTRFVKDRDLYLEVWW